MRGEVSNERLIGGLKTIVLQGENLGHADIVDGYITEINADGSLTVVPSDGTEPYKNVQISAVVTNDRGEIIKPTLYSDVTIATQEDRSKVCVVKYTYYDTYKIVADTEILLEVSETEEDSSLEDPDYDDINLTGKASHLRVEKERVGIKSKLTEIHNGGATEKALRGESLAQTLEDLIVAIGNITVVTSIGTQPIVNKAVIDGFQGEITNKLSEILKYE